MNSQGERNRKRARPLHHHQDERRTLTKANIDSEPRWFNIPQAFPRSGSPNQVKFRRRIVVFRDSLFFFERLDELLDPILVGVELQRFFQSIQGRLPVPEPRIGLAKQIEKLGVDSEISHR
jgi:hypothetical protein